MASLPGTDFAGFAAQGGGVSPARAAGSFAGDAASEAGDPDVLPTPRLPTQAPLMATATPSGGPRPLSLEVVASTSRVPALVWEAFFAELGCDRGDPVEDFLFIPAADLQDAVANFSIQGSQATSMQRGQATRLIAALHAFKAGPTSIEEIVATPVQPAMVVVPPQPAAAEATNKRRFAGVLD